MTWFGMLMFLFSLPVLCVTAVIIALIVRFNRPEDGSEEEETKLIQEMHRGLGRLEKRIESLETIVLDAETNRGGER